MTNIIKFPSFKDLERSEEPRLPQTENEVMKAIAVNRMVYVDDIVNQMFSNIATKLYHQGYPVDEEEFFKDFIMVGELTRSILYNSVGVEHPLYDIVTKNRERLQKLIDHGDIQFNNSDDEDDDDYEDDDE
jgi:hypothetical protein